ncbi:unnamed protein product, partial [Prorocentrum cordatum]
RESDVALYGCQLGKVQASLGDCKLQCVSHESEACTLITYYKTSTSSNCYFHCESAARRAYGDQGRHTSRRRDAPRCPRIFQTSWRSCCSAQAPETRAARYLRSDVTNKSGGKETHRHN